ncbi:MAG: hypothetical protein QOF68_1441 [Gaiellales bacterium]|nr:hypothetical protein [Gaiellales bacterium]
MVALTTVVLAAVAVTLADRPYGGAKASARVHVQDTIVSFQFTGQPQPYTPNRNVNELTRADFIDSQVAATAAKKLSGVTGQQLVSHLGFQALTGTEALLTYDGSTSPEISSRRLDVYVAAFIEQRRSQQRQALDQAATSVAGTQAETKLTQAADAVDGQIFPVGEITTADAKSIATPAALLGGALAGALLGLILALVLGRADRRIRTHEDLRLAGLRAIEVDSARKPESVDTLRALTEVAGIGSDGGVVAVASPSGDVRTPLARELATAFASSSRPTALLTESGGAVNREGVWTQIEGGLGNAMRSLPRLSDTVARLRPANGVAVIDAPAITERSEGVIASGLADVTVLVVQRNRTTWKQLEEALETLADAVTQGRVRVCLDRGRTSREDGVAQLTGTNRPGRMERIRSAV